MGMRRTLACALAAALTLGGVATSLAAPTVAEAYPYTATKPKQLKSELSYNESDTITLAGGKDYWFAGKVDIDHYEVEGGTAEKPTRLYFTSSSSLGGPLTVDRDLRYSQRPLFVLKGGYVEFIGDSGSSTEVYCNGKTFLSDNGDYGTSKGGDKPNTGKSLDLSVRDLKLISKTDVKYDSDRAITLYGTMSRGETAVFTSVNVSNWDCAKNAAGGFSNIASDYVASAAPVTIRGCHVALDATFNNCTFDGNCDDCVGALSVVGRAKRPKATLNNCSFKNNYQTMIACDSLNVEDGHVHSGNLAVKNAEVVLNDCSITSGPYTAPSWWRGPSAYMKPGYDMHMTSGIAVAKDASCTINNTAIDDSYTRSGTDEYRNPYSAQDAKRSTIYALGSVTLAGSTKVTTALAKGVDASDAGSYGSVNVDKSFTGNAVLSVNDDKFDPEKNPKGYYNEYVNLGTSALSQEDLANRLKLANADLTYEFTDGKVKVVHRKHEHAWDCSVNANGYSIAAKCVGQYEASQCNYQRDGDTISLMSSKDGDLSFTYNGKERNAVLVTTKPGQGDSAVAQGKVKITGARFYRRSSADDVKGFEMEGSVPTDAGFYRVVATVSIEGQDDVALERLFQIKPASLAEKDSDRKALCKIEVIGYDKLKDGVQFRGDTFNGVPSYKWTGKEIKPRIKVTYRLGGEWIELREGIDFEWLEWGESVSEKDPGVYRSQIWGLGNYIYGPFFYWTIYGTQFKNVQAKGFEGAYDGKAHTPSVTVDNDPNEMENFQVEYREDGGMWSGHIPSYTNVTRDIYGNLEAKTIEYKITAADFVPVEGTVTIKITPADQDVPKDVKTTTPSGHGLTDGSIEGLDDTCEWKVEGTGEYQELAKGQTTLKGLVAGKYNVRRKADRNHNASDTVTVEIKDGPKKADGKGWKHDDAEHWNTCTCGKEDVDRAAHDFEWVEDQAATADKPGKKHQRCKTCGYEREGVEIPAFGITGYSGAFDGKDHGVTVNTGTVASIKFREKGQDAWSDKSPVIKEVGTKTAEFQATLKSGDNCEGEVTLEVTPRAVTVKPKDASKTYGDADPDEFETDVVKGKLVAGYPLSGIKVSRAEGNGVGTYEMTAAQDEGANPNYALTFKSGTFTIKAKTLGISWSDKEFVYDGESHVAAATPTGVVAGDKVALKVEGAAKKAGTHTATVAGITGDAAGNYALPKDDLTCEFTIKKAPQGAPKTQSADESISGKHDGKITDVDASMEWCAKGAANYTAVPAGITELTGLAPDTYLVRYAATDNHDASADVEVTVAAGRKLKVSLPAKQEGYTLTASASELDWHQNLALTFTLADGYYKTNDFAVNVNGNPAALAEDGTATVAGIEDDATITVEGVAKHEAVKDAPWRSDENGHWHECTCGGKADETCDGKVDKAGHTLKTVIDKKPTATQKGLKHQECTVCGYKSAPEEIPAASVAGYDGPYDGAWHTVDTKNLPAGATIEYRASDDKDWTAKAPEIKDVGSKKVSYRATIDGVEVTGEVELKVTPRPITLKATDASKVYGEADPQLGYTVAEGSVVEGESLDGISVAREKGDTVKDGGYAITIAQEKGSNSNYDITLEPGTFTITQRPLRVTWGTTDFVYDGKAHAPAAALDNVLKGDEVEATVEGAQTEANREGELYSAIVTGLKGTAAGNYALPAEGLSHAFTIRCAPQDAPKVQAEAEGISGRHDGKITGVDAAMEWRAKNGTAYQPVSGDAKELAGLAPGTYLVRYQAKANHDASPDTEVTVAAGRKLTVTVPTQQVGYALTTTASELDWHGGATLTMSIDGRYFADKKAYAVKVNGKKVDLPADGTYAIKDAESDVNVTVEGVLRHEPDGTGWQSDGTDHWHICRCGDVIDKAAHDFEWVTDTPATVEAEGTRHQECKVCGAHGKDGKIDILAPAVVEGAGQTLTKAPEVPVSSDLTVRSNAPLRLFEKVLVDGNEVADTHYTLKEGSTIVTLKAAYLATLSTGEHRLSIVSESGTAETTFTIAEQQKPAGDSGGAATGGNGGTAKPSAPKGDAEKGAGTKTATGKAAKATMPTVGDGTFAAVAAVLAAGIASIVAALVVRRR